MSAIGATDIHYENLIASGEHPALVDLEGLFHPVLDENVPRDESDALVFKAYVSSVLRVGLLPNPARAGEDAGGADISALGSPEGKLAPTRRIACSWATVTRCSPPAGRWRASSMPRFASFSARRAPTS